MKCCSYPNTFDLVLGKEMQPGSCWISLFSVSRKMIIFSRQTWKAGEYFALLIFLGTNNLFGKWCHFYIVFVLCCETGIEVDVILRILQTGNRNKAILTVISERWSWTLESDPPSSLTEGKWHHNPCLSVFLCEMGAILSVSLSCDYEMRYRMENT